MKNAVFMLFIVLAYGVQATAYDFSFANNVVITPLRVEHSQAHSELQIDVEFDMRSCSQGFIRFVQVANRIGVLLYDFDVECTGPIIRETRRLGVFGARMDTEFKALELLNDPTSVDRVGTPNFYVLPPVKLDSKVQNTANSFHVPTHFKIHSCAQRFVEYLKLSLEDPSLSNSGNSTSKPDRFPIPNEKMTYVVAGVINDTGIECVGPIQEHVEDIPFFTAPFIKLDSWTIRPLVSKLE